MKPETPTATDVAIIGGGMAGTVLASVLAARSVRVTLIDTRDHCAPTFKAEKLEPDQADLLKKFGLFDAAVRSAASIDGVDIGFRGCVIDHLPIQQYGIVYHDLVNSLRAALPASVEQVVGRATSIALDAGEQHVALDDGPAVAARLVVMASGGGGKLHDAVGVRRRMISEAHSTTIGFSVARTDGSPFGVDAVTVLPDRLDRQVDYLSLFAFPSVMRANLFTYFRADDATVRRLINAPEQWLEEPFPRLRRFIGDYRVISKVEARPIDLWVADEAGRDGLVLMGDAFQSVCPATGTGLSKVLNDTDALADLIPQWLATPGMSAAKMRTYYEDPRKRGSDAASLETALFRRKRIMDRSLRMRVFRQREVARMAWRAVVHPAGRTQRAHSTH